MINIPRRYMLVIFCHLGLYITMFLRVNLSISIIPMKDEFHWEEKQKGILLSSFFWGYLFLQIPSGWLSLKIGGKHLFGLSIFVPSLLNLFIPHIASNFHALLIVRFLTGIFEGAAFPAIQSLLSIWAPIHDRSKMVGYIWAGGTLGSTIGMPLSGYICNSSWGWRGTFNTFGYLGVIYYIIWCLYIYPSPKEDPFITKEELLLFQNDGNNDDDDYDDDSEEGQREEIERNIEDNNNSGSKILKSSSSSAPSTLSSSSIQKVILVHNTHDLSQILNQSVPWKMFITTPSILAIYAVHFGHGYGENTLLTFLPTYFKMKFNYSTQQAGLVTFFPYLLLAIMSSVTGNLADYFIVHNTRILTVRTVCNSLGLLLFTFFVIIAGISNNEWICFLCITFAIGATGILNGGFIPNMLDVCPKFAGIIYACSNMTFATSGIIAPVVTGYLINGENPNWFLSFSVCGLISILGMIFYCKYGDDKVVQYDNVKHF